MSSITVTPKTLCCFVNSLLEKLAFLEVEQLDELIKIAKEMSRFFMGHQTIYSRSGLDINSRWLVEWKGLCQGMLMSDLGNAGQKDSTAILQCDEGDLDIACAFSVALPFPLALT
ncbi:hypothetical protein I315_06328 [Cryptococcus gattii Ru294]|nr:hypothetical protein I315_06328 [Cryptococcus gattii Ru294]